MHRIIELLLLISIFPASLFSQLSQLRVVGKPEKLEIDIPEVRDINGRLCAVIQVGSDMEGFTYDSYQGVVKLIDLRGKDMVFLQPDERVLEIYHSGYEPLKIILYEIGIRLKRKQAWEITIAGEKTFKQIPIVINTYPESVKVIIDDNDYGIGKLFMVTNVIHKIQLSKTGFVTLTDSITVDEKNSQFKFLLVPKPELVFVKGGTFQMGNTFGVGSTDEKPVHPVTVSDFYISKYEVTFEMYDAFCEETGLARLPDRGWGRGKHPVINVRWYDAIEFCNWLSKKQGLTPCYKGDKSQVIKCDFSANGYRLPTEAEWEYAAKGGSKSRGYKFSGSNNIDEVGWYYWGIARREVERFYEVYRDSLPELKDSVKISHILFQIEPSESAVVAARKKAEELLRRLNKGEDFAQLAKEYSEDSGSARKGGSLGPRERGDLVREFEEVAYLLEPGEISDIVRTRFGFHIIQLEDRRGDKFYPRHILIKLETSPEDEKATVERLKRLKQQILVGEITFEDAAQKYSKDETTSSKGGDLGWFQVDQFQIETFKEAIVGLKEGEISEPIKTKFGYHIIRVDKRPARKLDIKKDWEQIELWALNLKRQNAGPQTHAVGSKKPNELGLYDMSGNVWEWCWDWYDRGYYRYSPSKNPLGPTSGEYRVLRGGSGHAVFCRSSSRLSDPPDKRDDYNGFRVVRPAQ